jgi:hypothetical protein
MLTLPLHDLPTRCASGFIIRYILPRTLPPALVGPIDRKAIFDYCLGGGELLVGAGHGSPSLFCGHNNQVLLSANALPSSIKQKVIFLVSCETGQELGPALVAAGAQSYIGFKEDLVWILDGDKWPVPWSDKLGGLTMKPIVACMNSILDGNTVQTAFDTMLAGMQESIDQTDDELVKASLQYNLKNAVLLGDGGTKIRPTPHFTTPIPPPPILIPADLTSHFSPS